MKRCPHLSEVGDNASGLVPGEHLVDRFSGLVLFGHANRLSDDLSC